MGGKFERVRTGGFRWALRLVGAAVALVLCRWCLLDHQAFLQSLSPGCTFRRWSGCYCPGCGGTRAFFALLRGHLLASWRFNPLLLAGLATAGWFALIHGLEWLDKGGIRRPNRLRATPAAGFWFIGAVIAFWILRNLPWWPFTALAPHCA